jgi:N-acetylmuramoyl-L-alanine amidase
MSTMQSFGSILRWLALVLALALAAGFARAQTPEPPAVLDVRVGDHPHRTRFVLETTAPLNFNLFLLDRPYRVVIDFPPAAWQAGSELHRGLGVIAGFYQTAADTGTTRVVLDLARPARVRDVFYLPATVDVPYRFVLDLEPTDADTFAAEMRGPAERRSGVQAVAAAAPFPLPPPRPRPPRLPVVAIDAGHGGFDPGATGPDGLFEKEITLQVARRLRDTLEAGGRYRVVMVREGDEFLRLRERVRRARTAGADVFLSLHADSNPDPDLHGASVYTLSDRASDHEAALLAQRENRVDALVGIEMDAEDDVMASILIDLAQRVTRNESNLLAQVLVARLGEETRLLNRSHRQAGFAVLTAPDVPSVLVELGHLSNPRDARRLATAAYQERLAGAVAAAVDDYFARLGDLDG